VTFSAAHKYLGLTSEVLRTEKAINDIAYHPLSNSFYEGGGLQYLRQRFDGATSETLAPGSDYFSCFSTSSAAAVFAFKESSTASLGKISDNPIPVKGHESRKVSSSLNTSPRVAQAGDLLVPLAQAAEESHPLGRAYCVLNASHLSRPSEDRKGSRVHIDNKNSPAEFDLRDEVMSCIAKSIGLLQSPSSENDSADGSSHAPPLDTHRSSTASSFNSPFSSLSLLDVGDDESTMTGASSVMSNGDHMRGLDNEVEILYYKAGSILAKAGEVNAGKFSLNLTSNMC